MQIFVAEYGVAHALCSDADWATARLAGYGVDGVGCVVSGGDGVDGVTAKVTDRTPFDAYFGLVSGDWVEVETDQGFALAYVSDGPIAPFESTARQIETRIAQDVVQILAAPTPFNQPINRQGLWMRARSYVVAANNPAPVLLRAPNATGDVTVAKRELPYARYFDVEDLTLTHKRFDGAESAPMVRSVLRAADAVTVLPYDPVRDAVVLVEQFRPGAFVRGDKHPWVLEPVAGRCDGDEDVAEVARREMIEEAGLKLLSLESIGSYYPSPGCLSEYLYSFVGLVDLADAKPGVYGLNTENEDIRTHFLSFDEAMALVQTGEADNGPLLLSLYWLAAHRTRLRKVASTA